MGTHTISGFHVVLTGEDKYQDTQGNAIERLAKNLNMVAKMCKHEGICPYAVFAAGDLATDYMMGKFMEMCPFDEYRGKAVLYDKDSKHTSFKTERWNRFYFSQERFSREKRWRY